MELFSLLIIGVALLIAAGTKKVVEEVKSNISRLPDIIKAAEPVSKETQIPLAFIVTQAAHESNYGKSGLAQKSNNLFGIKATKSWTGPSDNWPTHEVVNGKEIVVDAYFRKYSTWEASVRDWARLIKAVYPKAFAAALANNSQLFFQELQKGGYATDPLYAQKLAAVYNNVKESVA